VLHYEFLKLYNTALEDIGNNKNVTYWSNTLAKYSPTFFGQCDNAIKMSKKYVYTWLQRGMLAKKKDSEINDTVEYLADYDRHLQHNTRLHKNELDNNTCLNITALEKDNDLQDDILSTYHCLVILAEMNVYNKVILNAKNKSFIVG